MLNIDAAMGAGAGELASDGGALARWLEVGGVTAFGFLVLAIVTAGVGYLVASLGWRYLVARRRERRLVRMTRRMDSRLREADKDQ